MQMTMSPIKQLFEPPWPVSSMRPGALRTHLTRVSDDLEHDAILTTLPAAEHVAHALEFNKDLRVVAPRLQAVLRIAEISHDADDVAAASVLEQAILEYVHLSSNSLPPAYLHAIIERLLAELIADRGSIDNITQLMTKAPIADNVSFLQVFNSVDESIASEEQCKAIPGALTTAARPRSDESEVHGVQRRFLASRPSSECHDGDGSISDNNRRERSHRQVAD